MKNFRETITGIMLQLLSLLHAKAIDDNGECREEKRGGKLGGRFNETLRENKKTFEGSSKAGQHYVNYERGITATEKRNKNKQTSGSLIPKRFLQEQSSLPGLFVGMFPSAFRKQPVPHYRRNHLD